MFESEEGTIWGHSGSRDDLLMEIGDPSISIFCIRPGLYEDGIYGAKILSMFRIFHRNSYRSSQVKPLHWIARLTSFGRGSFVTCGVARAVLVILSMPGVRKLSLCRSVVTAAVEHCPAFLKGIRAPILRNDTCLNLDNLYKRALLLLLSKESSEKAHHS